MTTNRTALEILEELHAAGCIRGENQWSGDMGTLVYPEAASESLLADILSLMERTKKGVAVGVPMCDYPELVQLVEDYFMGGDVGVDDGASEEPTPQEQVGGKQVDKLGEILEKFASIESPFDLFEPHLWYGKLGDEGWVCSIRSSHMTLWEGSGTTPLEAAQACYKEATTEVTT